MKRLCEIILIYRRGQESNEARNSLSYCSFKGELSQFSRAKPQEAARWHFTYEEPGERLYERLLRAQRTFFDEKKAKIVVMIAGFGANKQRGVRENAKAGDG